MKDNPVPAIPLITGDAVVCIEFESDEKAQAFRAEFGKDGKDSTHIRWNSYDDRAFSLVWLAEDDE